MDRWFNRGLTAWYKVNCRDLPWRNQNDPYLVWLSEIILQQTQVIQGLSYYNKFSSLYPDINCLAAAPEDEVLKHWQGLGYYSRARNLLATAKIIVKQYKGIFPRKYEDIRSLKGIGEYTAAAIASFAFDEPYAVVDGNVYRLLSRVFGIATPIDSSAGKKEFAALADSLLNKKEPALHNQAIMEFGSQFCRPVNPNCEECIFKSRCYAYSNSLVHELPVKVKKATIRDRYLNYILIADRQNHIRISKRKQKDIWHGLYEFNLVETKMKTSVDKFLLSDEFKALRANSVVRHVSEDYRHILTHQRLHARFIVVKSGGGFKPSKEIAHIDALDSFAFPRLIEKFLNDCDLKEIL